MAHPPKKNSPVEGKKLASHHKSSATSQKGADVDQGKPERIAKVIARAGLASRREAERLIGAGRVTLNGKKLDSPAINVTAKDVILVNGRPLPDREVTQIWRFHKPKGCITSHKDPEGRETAFDHLPEDMPRVISVGRLDYNTEGLLLMTNDGGLARHLELPATGWLRRYRVRARGSVSQYRLDDLKDGITIEGVKYGRIEAQLNRQDKANIWITVAIREGKNREIRRIFEHIGLEVNRLIRISYGPFMLGDLGTGQAELIKPKILIEQLGKDVANSLGIFADVDEKPLKGRFRREQVDASIKSKKPGSPKGGKSLKFGSTKVKTFRRDDRRDRRRNEEEAFEEGRPHSSSRRGRNAGRSRLSRAEKQEERDKARDTDFRAQRSAGRRGARQADARTGGRGAARSGRPDHSGREERGRSDSKRSFRPTRQGDGNRASDNDGDRKRGSHARPSSAKGRDNRQAGRGKPTRPGRPSKSGKFKKS